MASKTFFAVYIQALFIQCALSQCIGRGPALGAPFGLPYDGAYGAGCGCGGIASTGGSFPVSSFSPISPTGIKVISENAIEGSLAVGGQLPFLGTVAVEGILPTAGVGTISYGCGSGSIGITTEGPIATGIIGPGPAYGPAPPSAYGPGLAAGPLYGPGLGYNGLGVGCGCGL